MSLSLGIFLNEGNELWMDMFTFYLTSCRIVGDGLNASLPSSPWYKKQQLKKKTLLLVMLSRSVPDSEFLQHELWLCSPQPAPHTELLKGKSLCASADLIWVHPETLRGCGPAKWAAGCVSVTPDNPHLRKFGF